MSRIGYEVILNLLTVWLIVEAWARPPRGFHGSPMVQLFCRFTLYFAVVWLALNIVHFIGFKLGRLDG